MHTHRHWSDLSGADLPQTGFYELVTHPTIFVAKPVPGPSQAKTTADESTHLPCSQLPCGADSRDVLEHDLLEAAAAVLTIC